jgi:hypothetical protein
MCLVSDKIKFCTCVSGSVDKLQHYWILYRFNKDKMDDYMGQPIIPASITDSNFIINESTLLIRINEPDAFDTPLKLSSKDRLEKYLILLMSNIKEKLNEQHIRHNKKYSKHHVARHRSQWRCTTH